MGLWDTIKRGVSYVSPIAALGTGNYKGAAGGVMTGIGAATGNPALAAAGVGMGYQSLQDGGGGKEQVGKLINPGTGRAYRSNEEVPSQTPLPWETPRPTPQPLTVPAPSGGGGGYGSVGGGGGSYNRGGAAGTPDASVLSQYQQQSPEEMRHASFVSELARMIGGNAQNMYNISTPTYTKALDYYGRILSGNKAEIAQAMAPEADMINELTAGQQKAISTGSLRGGARDAALAEVGREGASQLAGLIPKARRDAASAGSQTALAGIGQATGAATSAGGLGSALQGAAQQNRQFGISAEMQNRYQAAGIDLQWAQHDLAEKLGMRGLDLQQMGLALNERLGQRGLDLQEMLGMGGLQLQRELGLMGINLNQQQVDLLRRELDHKIKTGQGEAIGNIGGAIIQALPLIMGSGGGGGSSTSFAPEPDVLSTNNRGFGTSLVRF